MRSSYPAPPKHRRILKDPPKRRHCLSQRELRNLRYQANHLVYLWQKNGNAVWFRIQGVRANTLVGYRLDRGTWRWAIIPMDDICSYY